MEPVAVAVADEQPNYIQWMPAIAGALAAAALAFVLHSFAAAIGLAVSSTAPTWRDASLALQLLSGLYLVFVAIVAFGVGGYIAGRMRAPIDGSEDEVEFRDGTHGLLVWAIAMVITVLMAGGSAVADAARGAIGRPGRHRAVGRRRKHHRVRPRSPVPRRKRPQNADLTYARSEAARILLTTASHRGIQSDDRAYLVRLTAANTGLAAPEAEKRVDTIITQARDNIRKARRAGVILAFMAGAAALLGAAVAWFAAGAGGRASRRRARHHR